MNLSLKKSSKPPQLRRLRLRHRPMRSSRLWPPTAPPLARRRPRRSARWRPGRRPRGRRAVPSAPPPGGRIVLRMSTWMVSEFISIFYFQRTWWHRLQRSFGWGLVPFRLRSDASPRLFVGVSNYSVRYWIILGHHSTSQNHQNDSSLPHLPQGFNCQGLQGVPEGNSTVYPLHCVCVGWLIAKNGHHHHGDTLDLPVQKKQWCQNRPNQKGFWDDTATRQGSLVLKAFVVSICTQQKAKGQGVATALYHSRPQEPFYQERLLVGPVLQKASQTQSRRVNPKHAAPLKEPLQNQRNCKVCFMSSTTPLKKETTKQKKNVSTFSFTQQVTEVQGFMDAIGAAMRDEGLAERQHFQLRQGLSSHKVGRQLQAIQGVLPSRPKRFGL